MINKEPFKNIYQFQMFQEAENNIYRAKHTTLQDSSARSDIHGTSSSLKLDVIDRAMEKIHQYCGRDELFGWLITESVSCPLCSHNWIANALLLQRLDGLILDHGVTLDQE